ncbi:crossover junction endodeoxyribonuclease RuvC [Labilibaculum sp. DW002]|uniref:Crossover junction endodeoxyribonuclease RuvC n=1 Tax=Paralabilibaculum antarcticum TaxID=2912572 RepID=A0ABT5VSE0_9BACT|nr:MULTISPECIES: crossover junction endodeoxyribonuclease RuvC [unclassified Labilibaculum]MDE5418339.1 crossover junction endodeoxyribonuclease RuvC [Labilibaculum sp. DW002]
MSNDRIIMGIDPGTNLMGYGLIRVVDKKPQILVSGVVDMKKITDPYIKLQKIFQRTLQVIDEYHPDELAIESQFFGKNVQSMLKLGRAQGVAISAALHRNIPIFEYAPKKIKLAITGTGLASKEQMATILQRFFKMKDFPQNSDETDAIAIAMCHFFQGNNPLAKAKPTSWADFAKKNPDRIKK